MQIKGKYTWLKHLDFMIVDLLSLVLSFTISYWTKFGNIRFSENDEWTRLLLVISLLNILIALFTSPYSGIFRRSYYMEIRKAFELAIINLASASIFIYLFKLGAFFSREVFFVMYGGYFILSLLLKYIWKKLLINNKITINTTRRIPLFIISDKKSIRKVLSNTLTGDFLLYDVQGIGLTDESKKTTINKITVITSGFVSYVLENNITDVLISVPPTSISTEDYQKLADNGINVHISIEAAAGFQTEEQFITNIGVYKTLSIGEFTFTPGQMIYLFLKRIMDLLCGLIGLIILVPITIGVKAAYLLSGDKAKVFYRQSRIGQYGKPIRIWKFRSMVPNANEILTELLKQEKYRKEWEENQKFENDPRITRVGRVLRKTSIDELPQLINVLLGEMSLVGDKVILGHTKKKPVFMRLSVA